ncbi:putative RNA-directed DNA polymerase from transposon X-element [Trichonephila clavipes]|nr:putative RNA-directed DNA polymerase from transposon X-element [Trichonephila clavipes]
MALDNHTDMDFTPQSPLSSASNGTAPTPCEELTSMKIYFLRRLQIICSEKERTVSLLRQDKGHHESDTLYQLAWNEYQDVQSSLQQADSQEIGIENQFSLLPNVIIKQVSGQLASSAAKNSESTTTANQNNRSNALPPPLMLKTDENYRVQDLEKEGFEPDRVTQLVGRRTKQLLPIFQVTLPRTIENLKIFDLKTLAHLNITVDGYNGRGVTQCFSCNNFHHNADNCYLKPRCLKCGEEHLTKDCPIKQRLKQNSALTVRCTATWPTGTAAPVFLSPLRALLKNDRPTSNENYRAFGGTLILIKNSIKHYSLPTPSMQTIEATIVILTPIDHDPISIVSIYIPPRSDEYTFTIDIENLIQTSSNCVLFGDFNAPHTAWNCNTNSSRGVRLLDYVNMTNLYIAYPDSPTRFGINSANTLDIAVIRNFYYPYTINSLHDLSSDHNPVLLNFTLKLKKDTPNPRAVHTNWPLFSKHLNTKLSLINYHPNSIKTSTDIDQKFQSSLKRSAPPIATPPDQ